VTKLCGGDVSELGARDLGATHLTRGSRSGATSTGEVRQSAMAK
jgi:hypothetical protein